jgi:hypothetical protein
MRKFLVIAACCVVIIGGGFWLVSRQGKQPEKFSEGPPTSPEKKRMPIAPEKVIDYGKLKEKSDESLTALMEERKAPYGIDKGVDMIVKPDESIKVGDQTVKMKKILDEVRLKQGEILEADLETGVKQEQLDDYGIHVVEPGENIWAIHFKLLKDYFEHKGIQLAPLADEPSRHGFSSGVGKVLKFSEQMVYIYNLKEAKLDTNLNLIYPLSKIVVYNMRRVFSLLDRIDYKDVNRIEFDGETLWLPAVQ